MQNPFLLSTTGRLRDWHAFRKSLATRSESDQLEAVARYWAQAPLVNIAFDPEDCERWLTPWEMIHVGKWCRSSIALGMEATLRLAGWHHERLLLRHIIDFELSAMICVLKVDDMVLNYQWGHVAVYPKTKHKVMRQWRHDGRRFVEL